MEHVISTFAKKLYTQGNHVGYVLKYKHLQPICKKWSKNRNPECVEFVTCTIIIIMVVIFLN